MIGANVALECISHAGEVSWQQFVAYVETLLGEKAVPAYFRRSLSRLGHIDYLPQHRRCISAAPQTMAVLPHESGRAKGVLCGRRTTESLKNLREAASLSGLTWTTAQNAGAPDSHILECASESGLETFAANNDLAWAGVAADRLAHVLPCDMATSPLLPLSELEETISHWINIATGDFVQDRPSENAICVTTSFGRDVHFFVREQRARKIGKYEALHAAAATNGVVTLTYDPARRIMSVLGRTPLPFLHERAACISSGSEPIFVDGRLLYSNISKTLFNRIHETLIQKAKEFSP